MVAAGKRLMTSTHANILLLFLSTEVPQRPKFKLGTSGGDTQRNFKGPACGQCEQKAVALVRNMFGTWMGGYLVGVFAFKGNCIPNQN